MRQLAFNVAVYLSATSIWLLDKSLVITVGLLVFLNAWSKVGAAKLGVLLMNLAMPGEMDRLVEEQEAQEELEQQATELELLSNATKLKEHAMKIGDWTDDHSEALNAIGNALLNECDWDEEHVHQYLKDVVENGTGLSYHSSFDGFDDDDDDDAPWPLD